jgi:hypothetical protein
VLDGLVAVLRGEAPSYACEYACHRHAMRRRSLMNVGALATEEGSAVVSHTEIGTETSGACIAGKP